MFGGPYNESNLPGALSGDRYWNEAAWLLKSIDIDSPKGDSLLRVVESSGKRAGMVMCEVALSEMPDPVITKSFFRAITYAPQILLANIYIINAACHAASLPSDVANEAMSEVAMHCQGILDEINKLEARDVTTLLIDHIKKPVLTPPTNGDYFGMELRDSISGNLLCSLPLDINYEEVKPDRTRHEVRARWFEISLIMNVPYLAQNILWFCSLYNGALKNFHSKAQQVHQLTERHLENCSSRPLSDFELFGVHQCDVCSTIGVWPLFRYRVRTSAGHRSHGFGAEFPIDVDEIPGTIPLDHDSLAENKIETEVVCPACYRL